MQELEPEKNGLPGKLITGGQADRELKSEQKELSPFCNDCKSATLVELKDTNVFIDRYGFAWRCGDPLGCRHAITDGPVIMDCMVLNRLLRKAPGSMQDLPSLKNYPEKRRKFRAQLAEELKTITGMRLVVS